MTLDLATFLLAGILILKIQKQNIANSRANIFNPLKYVWRFPKLRDILLLRSIGFWFGAGLFNYLLFSVVTDRFHLDIVNSAWIYSALGLGATIGIYVIRNPKSGKLTFVGQQSPESLAFAANILMGCSVFLFFNVSSFISSLSVVFFHGIGLAINASSTQAIRRREASPQQFSEIVGLEVIIGRSVDVSISAIAMFTISRSELTYGNWLVVSAISSFLVGLIYFRKSLIVRKELSWSLKAEK